MSRGASLMWVAAPARSGSCVDLATFALVLTMVASIVFRTSETYAEAAQEPAFAAADPAAQTSARAIDLVAIEGRAAAVATTSRTVYEEAGRILDGLASSGFPDDQILGEAVVALRRVAKLSYHLATASEVLADAVDVASTGQVPGSGALAQALEEFDAAETEFNRSADELLKQIRLVDSHEQTRRSLSDEIARLEIDDLKTELDRTAVSRLQVLEQKAIDEQSTELQALIRLTDPYAAAQEAVLSAISELAPLLAPPVTRETSEPGISLSVYGFFDQAGAEEEDYGLYTYVILAQGPGAGRRNVAFLRELFASTQRTKSELSAVRRQLNIFYVPVQDQIQALVIARTSADAADAAAAIAAPGTYDYERAERLLFRLCTESADSDPKLCASAWGGPYLLTVPEPVSASAAMSPTRLLVDLSAVHERAFGEFIRALKEQVMRLDFTDRQKIDTVRLGLLDITLKAADWLNPIKEGIAEIVFLGDETAR